MNPETIEQRPAYRPLKPWMGIVVFAAVIAATLLIAAPLQYFLGMTGLALTELLLLLIALAAAAIFRQNFRDVFPVRRPALRQIIGTVLLWIGTYLLVLLSTLVLMYFFPEGFADVSNSMTGLFSSVAFPIMFFITAIMPAVCEEALHRGFIQHCFYGFRHSWTIILLTGIIFGIFHLDPYRFLPTALLGMGLAYLMLKTENLFCTALFHFINNAFASFASLGTAETEVSAELLTGSSGMLSIGSYLIIGSAAPFCLLGAALLLRKKSQPKGRLLFPVLAACITAAIMFFFGIAVTAHCVISDPTLLSDYMPK